MRVDSLQLSQTAVPAAERRNAKAANAAFGAVLAQASTTATTPGAKPGAGATGPAPAASAPGATPTATTKSRAGEQYAQVAGHRYEEIVSGPRNGMFINRSGNKRDGEAFVRVERGDRVFHIYGSGKNRLIVGMRMHHPSPPAAGGPPQPQPAPAASTPAAKTPAAVSGGTHSA